MRGGTAQTEWLGVMDPPMYDKGGRGDSVPMLKRELKGNGTREGD